MGTRPFRTTKHGRGRHVQAASAVFVDIEMSREAALRFYLSLDNTLKLATSSRVP